jgi:hypothetical protein
LYTKSPIITKITEERNNLKKITEMGGKESSKYLVNTKEDPQNSIDIKIAK